MSLQSASSNAELDAHHDWSKKRIQIGRIITDGKSELVLAFMVLLSLALIIIDADHRARGEDAPLWTQRLENALLLLYSIEMVLRLYVFRRNFFQSALNVVDLFVVLIDAAFFFVRLSSIELPKFTFLRVLRLAKLSRAFHILLSQEPLYIMVEAFLASLKTLFFGCLFISVALIIYGIIAVEFMRPLENVEFSPSCGVCPAAFASVWQAICTLIQTNIVADEWGDLFRPFLYEYPQSMVFIFTVFVTVNFGLMNLIMAVIVDSAAQARIHNTKRIAEERDREFKAHQKSLQKLCREMDSDGSQTITFNELMSAFESNMEFKTTLHAMDIDREDLEAVFNILDDDGSGDVAYDEFVQQLYKMKTNNSSTMLVFIKHYITEVRRNVAMELDILKDQLAGGIEKLHVQVKEEMQLIKSDMQVHLQEAGVGRAVHRTENDIQKLAKGDKDRLQEAVASLTEEKLGEQIALSLQDLRRKCEADSPLQTAMERINGALEDVKSNCESSVILLSTFNNLIPSSNWNASSWTHDGAHLSEIHCELTDQVKEEMQLIKSDMKVHPQEAGSRRASPDKVPPLQLDKISKENSGPQSHPRVQTIKQIAAIKQMETRESRGCVSGI
mmetsp:Transcript_45683/g.85626  ORF Transcript_45683/g.85626 Transcript_45683/m.85626 type:complete len:615 (+) Transcript_45683:70-1914(+)